MRTCSNFLIICVKSLNVTKCKQYFDIGSVHRLSALSLFIQITNFVITVLHADNAHTRPIVYTLNLYSNIKPSS